MTILLTGATGRVGGAILTKLLERGVAVRVVAREPERLAGRGLEVVAGDLAAPETLERALAGITCAFLYAQGERSADLAAVLRRAGVAQAVVLSTIDAIIIALSQLSATSAKVS